MYRLIKISNLNQVLFIISLMLLISSCNSGGFQKVDTTQFVGTWELKGRPMFDGVQIEISRNKLNKYTGKLIKLNDNKYIKTFAELGDIWVTEIKRTSNYEFKLTEKKIGSALFSLYDLSTSKEFKVQFIDKDTIGLSAGTSNPSASSVQYVRVLTEE